MEVSLASYTNPNMIYEGDWGSWPSTSSVPWTEDSKKSSDNFTSGDHPLEAEPNFLIKSPAVRASNQDSVPRNSLQCLNSPVLTAVKRKAESEEREVKKHQQSAELLFEASPSSPNIRQSQSTATGVILVDNRNAATPTVPPTSDLEGAFQSLRGWLSTEAIQKVLEVFADSSYRILDGAYLSAALLDQKDKPPIRLQPHERTVIAPICYHDHWTLAIFALDEKRIRHYDSLRPPSDRIKSVTLAFAKGLNNVDEWVFDDMDCPKQTNQNDCGINTLVAALYWMAGLGLPRIILDSPEIPNFMRENRKHRQGVSTLLREYETVCSILHCLSIKKTADRSRLHDQLTESTKDISALESTQDTLPQISPEFRLGLQNALEESKKKNKRKIERIKKLQGVSEERFNQLQVVMSRVQVESARCHNILARISFDAKIWLEESSNRPSGQQS
ncbi:MAG: hypothetical protein Q9182_006596 [Xanthomendoza sp. 2 TL-2023]